MAETKEKTTEEKETPEKKTSKKKKELVANTMSIQLVNSAGDEITATGTCSDQEIKRVCKALNHTEGQKFEVVNHG